MAHDYRFRLSVCNELFEQTPFDEQCRAIKKAGWQGIEIAPFTLQTDATTLPAGRRRETRDIIVSEGLEFVGLHWLTVGPTGLHVTTPDESVRRRSWDYVRGLVDLCADLRADDRAGGVMVFGSPNQRKTTGGLTSEQAKNNYIEGVRSIAGHLESRGVTLCVEALPLAQCDVILTLDEAAEVVRAIGSPAVQTMFDSHNAIDETEPHAALVRRHWDLIRHIHVNELDGSYPRAGGGYDFKPVLQVAKDRNFSGWVSMEVFDFTPGSARIVNDSIQYLQGEIAQLNSA
jgi:D-psicose/D-tagatose/L-ribulose 3-epimerase